MSRSVTLVKGKNNMIGISIGGGAPFCPVLYVVQVSSFLAPSSSSSLYCGWRKIHKMWISNAVKLHV